MIFNDLALFTAVAQHLSFSEAANQIGIPLSRVSRRIAELEDHLGVKLFERTTRQVRLTEEGRRLLDSCQEPVEALQDIAGFAEDTKRQIVRITAPPLAARTTIGPRLLDFMVENPGITFNLTTTNLMLDFFRDNIDLAFRLGPLSDSNLTARRLWSVPYGFCASCEFLTEHEIDGPIRLQQLLHLPAIVARQSWVLKSGEQIQPKNIVHEIDDLELIAKTAGRNIGIAMLPKDMITGTLKELTFIDAVPVIREMFAVYPARRLLPARIRNLIDFMSRS